MLGNRVGGSHGQPALSLRHNSIYHKSNGHRTPAPSASVSDHTDPSAFLPLPHLPLHVLLALAEGAPAHGWELIKRIGRITEGRSAPSSGSLYLAMARLEERGLLRQVPTPLADSDARRRYYELTRLGRRVLRAEAERLAGLVELARSHRIIAR